MRLLIALGVVALLFAISPIAGGIALGVLGVCAVFVVLAAPSKRRPELGSQQEALLRQVASYQPPMAPCPKCETPTAMGARFCSGCGLDFGELQQKIAGVVASSREVIGQFPSVNARITDEMMREFLVAHPVSYVAWISSNDLEVVLRARIIQEALDADSVTVE